MMTGWPVVTRLKYFRSPEMCQGIRLPFPMAPLAALATISDIIGSILIS